MAELMSAILRDEELFEYINAPSIEDIIQFTKHIPDIIKIHNYFYGDDLYDLRSYLLSEENLKEFTELDTLFSLRDRLSVDEINELNIGILIDMIDKYNIKLYVNPKYFPIIINDKIIYHIYKSDQLNLLKQLPRNQIYISRIDLNSMIKNDIEFTQDELSILCFTINMVEGINFTEELINKIPDLTPYITLDDNVIIELLKIYDFNTINILLNKAKIKYKSIDDFIMWADELLNNTNIIWCTKNLEYIKQNNNIYLYYALYLGEEVLNDTDIKYCLTDDMELINKYPRITFKSFDSLTS